MASPRENINPLVPREMRLGRDGPVLGTAESKDRIEDES